MHYHVPFPSLLENGSQSSYFDASASDLIFQPIDPNVHKPISTQQFLNKKLRWMTLGGQYDWTNKVYPFEQPPPFPPDIKHLIRLHRVVSEECDQPLVSISLGCDGVFVVGLESTAEDNEPRVAAIRLRSGDAVIMSSESRYAWHGVPKVLEGTCPEWMHDWPFDKGADDEASNRFQHWKGWMKGKRINLNVRQMFA